jgi:3-deoxy-7-phosphoheptulonate synthase
MREQIENRNLVEVTPLVPPRDVKAKLPLTEKVGELVLRTRHEIREVLHGRDADRLVVVVGPCSIHDPEAAFEYARRLRGVIDATRKQLVVLMRTYFEKPRTTVGWKGLINDPRLDGSCDIAAGIELARSTLLEINALGVPCASEALDPVTPDYIADLLSWASIGARTAESQTHRQMASGLSMPIGFKNGTDGSVDSAKNAMISAGHPHSFLGVSPDGAASVLKTTGNPDRHIVLRGGGGRPNYRADDVARAAAIVADEGMARAIMVDCSHANSGKDHTRQGDVCREVLAQIRTGEPAIMGLMLESNLKPGKQTWKPDVELEHGVSITDACIGWEETEALLGEIAETVSTKSAT